MDLEGKTIFWFRRDLRLEDNHGLYRALSENVSVIPLFIFDTHILDKLPSKKDARVTFIHQTLLDIKKQLNQVGSDLMVFHGKPEQFFQEQQPSKVYTNRDYEPYALERDTKIADIINDYDGDFKSYKDQVIFEPDEIVKNDGAPYTVFTPYMKKWKSRLEQQEIPDFNSSRLVKNFSKIAPSPFPSLKELGFEEVEIETPAKDPSPEIITHYHENRNYPGIKGTSGLSIHLRFGTVSIRKVASMAGAASTTFLNELIWREFYMMILWHFPYVAERSFKKGYDQIAWRNDESQFEKWCQGKTGYPIVDAGMRELNETGYMHNRSRMITASFLCKTLLIDWRWGEAYFADKLLDFELSSNNGGWQWAAGTGCDAAPYFRIFNPYLQARKYDPDLKYIRQWIPEYGTKQYPNEIVDYKTSREEALKLYESALQYVRKN